MDYIKKEFKAGDILSALDLNNMGDGIEEAIGLAEDAALKGAQADYNENDSTSASYIKNRPFYEDNAYEPITWDGNMEGREYFDFSSAAGEEPGTVYAVKISDTILTSEDFLGSTVYCSDGYSERIEQVMPPEVSEEIGAYGIDWLCSVFDTTKISIATGVAFPSTGLYIQHWPSDGSYSLKLSKTVIQKIDKKFIPVINNIEEGTGENATQQSPRPDKTNLTNDQGQLCFEGDNPFVNAEDDLVPYGAFGKSSVSLGGRSCAYATHSMATNSKTVALGEESLATGYATIALGGASFSGGSQTIARAEASTALGHKNDAAAPYTFVHGAQNVAGGTYQAVFGVANENNTDNLFEIGNGKLDENGNVIERVNALAVTRDGRVKVQNLDLSAMEVNDLVPMAVLTQGIKMIEENRNIQNGDADGSIQQKYGAANAVGAAAFGTHTQANAEASLSCGAHTIADQYAQTVVGKYNNKTSRNGSLFVVGGGVSDSERRNTLEVISDGEIVIYWEGAYYSLNNMLNLIANAHGGTSFFDAAKKE
jgi:hypothetical protein